MSLASALSIANSGLANVSAQLALVSHNVANASTPSYSVENFDPQSLTAGGVGMGVLTGPAVRSVNQALQTEALAQNSTEETGLNTNITNENTKIAADKTSLTTELNTANQILQSIPEQLDEVNEIYSASTGYNQTQN